jgi:uncharacterized protein (TIGR02145 family)
MLFKTNQLSLIPREHLSIYRIDTIMKKTKFYFFMCCTLMIAGCCKDSIDSTDLTFKDSRDQHVYKYVNISKQSWMAENLAWLPAINPPSDNSETEPRYFVYDYEVEDGSVDEAKTKTNYTTYGVLYNWVAAKAACPAGWRLPSDEEWKILETFLGMSQSDADDTELRMSGSIGNALKFTSGWTVNGNGDNSSGFAALPGGQHYGAGSFKGLGGFTNFWSSSEEGSNAWIRVLYDYTDGVLRYSVNREGGFSVRCLRNK